MPAGTAWSGRDGPRAAGARALGRPPGSRSGQTGRAGLRGVAPLLACLLLAGLLLAGLSQVSPATAAEWTWALSADANWNDAGAWTGGGFPALPGDIARIVRDIDSNVTITLANQVVSVGQLLLADPVPSAGAPDPNVSFYNSFTIRSTGAGSLTFDSGLSGQAAVLDVAQPAPNLGAAPPHVILAPIVLTSDLSARVTGEAALGGPIAGEGGILRAGFSGTLYLDSNDNTFAGGAAVLGGTLMARATGALGSGSTITLGGGTLALWANSGQPAFWNKDLLVSGDGTVRVDGNDLYAGGAHSLRGLSVADGRTLTVTGANGSDLTFEGPAALAARATFNVDTLGGDLVLAGALAGTGTLVKRGAGVLSLTAGADANYTGGAEVREGVLSLEGSAVLTGASRIAVYRGATFILDNSTTNLSNRLADSNGVTMAGGTFQFVGAEASPSTESAGVLWLSSGNSWIMLTPGLGGGSALLTFASLARQAGATVNFAGVFGTAADQVRLSADGNLVVTKNRILGGWATAGTEWASYDPNLGVLALAAAYSLADANDTAWTINSNVRPAAAVAMTANRTIHSLNLVVGSNVDAGNRTLNLVSGGLLSAGGDRTISNGKLTAGGPAGGELFVTVDSAWTLTVTAAIVDANNGSSPVTLVKSGGGTMILGHANSYTGGTHVAEGVLEAIRNADANLGGSPLGTGPLTLNSSTVVLRSDADITWAGGLATTGDSTIRLDYLSEDANSLAAVAHALGDAVNDGNLTVLSEGGLGAALVLGELTGSGQTTVADHSALTAARIVQDGLVVGAGAVVTLGGPDFGSAAVALPEDAGRSGGPSDAIPEPATAALLALGALGLVRRHRR